MGRNLCRSSADQISCSGSTTNYEELVQPNLAVCGIYHPNDIFIILSSAKHPTFTTILGSLICVRVAYTAASGQYAWFSETPHNAISPSIHRADLRPANERRRYYVTTSLPAGRKPKISPDSCRNLVKPYIQSTSYIFNSITLQLTVIKMPGH